MLQWNGGRVRIEKGRTLLNCQFIEMNEPSIVNESNPLQHFSMLTWLWPIER